MPQIKTLTLKVNTVYLLYFRADIYYSFSHTQVADKAVSTTCKIPMDTWRRSNPKPVILSFSSPTVTPSMR